MTYDEIKAGIMRYMTRTDVTDADVDQFIEFTEIRLREMLRLQEMHQYTAISAAVVDEGLAPVPDDFIEFTTLYIGDKHLKQVSEQQMRDMINDVDSRDRLENKPTYYSRSGEWIRIWPYYTDRDTAGYGWYYFMPPGLSSSNQSNIISENYGDIYFWRCLAEAYTRFGYDERAPVFDAKFQEAIVSAQNLTKRAEFSGSVQQIRPRQSPYMGY